MGFWRFRESGFFWSESSESEDRIQIVWEESEISFEEIIGDFGIFGGFYLEDGGFTGFSGGFMGFFSYFSK